MLPLPRYIPTDRTISLSDAVFAVVITVLVLGIDVPSETITFAEFLAHREKLIHQALIYVVTFWLVGMYWSQHTLLLGGLCQMDRGMQVLNLGFLLPVSLLPFVTQLMGSMRNEWRVVFLFALTNFFAAFLFERLWLHAYRRPELHKTAQTAKLGRRIVWRLRFFYIVLAGGVLLSLVDVKLGILLFLLLPIIHFYNFSRATVREAEESSPNAS
jgi:uncharacterized membrane protein